MSKKLNRRARYLIVPGFQLSFIGFMAGICGINILIFYASNLYFFVRFKNLGKSFGLPSGNIFFQFIAQQEAMMNKIFIGSSILMGLICVLLGVLFSHRISGPIYRLEQHFSDLLKTKEFKEVKFRKYDFFQGLALVLNEYMKTVYLSREKDKDNSKLK